MAMAQIDPYEVFHHPVKRALHARSRGCEMTSGSHSSATPEGVAMAH